MAGKVTIYKKRSSKDIYSKISERKQFELNSGLAGMVAKERRSVIINDIKNSMIFNKVVDIVSILPVVGIPIMKYY